MKRIDTKADISGNILDTVDLGDGEVKTMQSYTGDFFSVKGGKLHFFLYFD
ncbi:MAG: hypothetical protein IKP52_02360 [Prevotella sp.]|nr:hypothetical protein [Prevotella sp.]MBR7049767.1 hypothetical protein [Prevotella sp.]